MVGYIPLDSCTDRHSTPEITHFDKFHLRCLNMDDRFIYSNVRLNMNNPNRINLQICVRSSVKLQQHFRNYLRHFDKRLMLSIVIDRECQHNTIILRLPKMAIVHLQ